MSFAGVILILGLLCLLLVSKSFRGVASRFFFCWASQWTTNRMTLTLACRPTKAGTSTNTSVARRFPQRGRSNGIIGLHPFQQKWTSPFRDGACLPAFG